MLLIVIAALGVVLVVQRRREADLQARLAQSWPVYLKQQREEAFLRRLAVKRSPGGAQQQEPEDAELDREIEAMKALARERSKRKPGSDRGEGRRSTSN